MNLREPSTAVRVPDPEPLTADSAMRRAGAAAGEPLVLMRIGSAHESWHYQQCDVCRDYLCHQHSAQIEFPEGEYVLCCYCPARRSWRAAPNRRRV